MADELSWSGPKANDVGSASRRYTEHPALWFATEPPSAPTPGQPSQKVHTGVFLVPRAENTMSQVVARPQGAQERRRLSDPPNAQSNHNRPTAKAQSHYSASPPRSPASDAVSPKPRERALPREKAFNLAQGAQWKVLLFIMVGREEKRERREEQGNAITLLNTTCLSLGGGGTSKGRDKIR